MIIRFAIVVVELIHSLAEHPCAYSLAALEFAQPLASASFLTYIFTLRSRGTRTILIHDHIRISGRVPVCAWYVLCTCQRSQSQHLVRIPCAPSRFLSVVNCDVLGNIHLFSTFAVCFCLESFVSRILA